MFRRLLLLDEDRRQVNPWFRQQRDAFAGLGPRAMTKIYRWKILSYHASNQALLTFCFLILSSMTDRWTDQANRIHFNKINS